MLLRCLRLLPAILLVLAAAPGWSQSPWPPGPEPAPWVRQAPRAEEAPEPRMSMDEAVALVRERTGGRVVRADRREADGRVFYEIRVLTGDGRVRTYRVDAASGAMR